MLQLFPRASKAFLFLFFFFGAMLSHSQWLDWSDETATRLTVTSVAQSDDEEKDFWSADLNNDGMNDVIVVRKEPFSLPSEPPKSDLLLMNVNGVLVDQTSIYAPEFISNPTFARDVYVDDFDADESAMSRIWGGIHPPCDDVPGRLIGIEVGQDAFAMAEAMFTDSDADGTCDYYDPACVADLNNDGLRNVSDLTIFLADIGCTGSNCIGDMDGNGTTGISDLINFFIPNYGQNCE